VISPDFTGLVGHTPCVRYDPGEPLAARIWVKLEGFNPTASVKDRACVYILQRAVERGELKPGMELLDASSGNFACALAYFGTIMGHRVTVVCSSKLTADKKDFIRFFGARLEMIGDFTIEGNRHCRDVILARDPDRHYFVDQLHNWDNPGAHYVTTGPEILADFPTLAAVAGSLGSGGTMNGTAKFLKQQTPVTQIIAVEAASGTKLPGTGSFSDGDYVTPFILEMTKKRLADHRCQVSLEQAQTRTRDLTRQGFFVGLQTGGVVDSAVRIAREQRIAGDIVCVSGDSGWKNMEKLKAL
jgi:cysteine synthase